MKKAHLSACPSCTRHVRVSEEVCPFCGAPLSDAFRAEEAPKPPRGRLTRAALYAFGAGSITFATACGGSTNNEPEDASPPILDAAYGAPPIDSGKDVEQDTSQPPLFDAAYGGPPIDAGSDAEDASHPIVDAAYGGPPFDAQGGALYGAPPLPDSGSH